MKLVDVLFDVMRLVIVPDAEVRSAIFALLIVVVARAEVPVTASDPVTRALVVVELVTVRPVILASVEKKLEIVPFVEKRFVDVALVVVLFVTLSPPIVAIVATRLEKKPFVDVLFVITESTPEMLVE